jgi:hypothetical protein
MILAIGIPSNGLIHAETMFCTMEAVMTARQSLVQGFLFFFPRSCYVHDNRNTIIRDAMKKGATRVLFIDGDMYFDSQLINKLASHHKDIVAAIYNIRGKLPLVPAIKLFNDEELVPKGLFKCKGIATGLMMINLNVFKKIKKPWFFFEYLGPDDEYEGEDYYFCNKVLEAGFDIWCDSTLDVKHIGEYKY